MTDYRVRESVSYDIYEDIKPETFYLIFSQEHRMGIICGSHEMDIRVKIHQKKNGEYTIRLLSAWEISCGEDWGYNCCEQKAFEADHPGLLADILSQYVSGKAVIHH